MTKQKQKRSHARDQMIRILVTPEQKAAIEQAAAADNNNSVSRWGLETLMARIEQSR